MSETRALTNYDKAYADMARQYAEDNQVTGGAFVSTKGGVLSFNDEELPGNQMAVVVLDAVKENTYYAEKYSADTPTAPTCYAFGRGAEAMAPHISMADHLDYFVPQSNDCASCRHNVFGSAEQGRGKACQNRRRLAMIAAGYYEPKRGSRDFDLQLFTDPKHYETAEIIMLKLSVGSVKNWSKYVGQISAAHHLPPFGVITRVSIEPDPKYQYVTHFEMLEPLPEDMAALLFARNDEAVRSIITPYSPPDPNQQPAAPQGRGQLPGLRRK